MANLNKLNAVSSPPVARAGNMPKTSAESGNGFRQIIAEVGKNLPGRQEQAEQSDTKTRELNNALKQVSGYVQNITRELNFSIDEELGRTVVTVLDDSTGELIRQIPSEDMLELSKNLAEIKQIRTKGLLFSTDA